jgi:patatin-related protein
MSSAPIQGIARGLAQSQDLENSQANKEPSAARQIKEKELRIALVCYGGVSLAIYQHGITKEILNLVRASRSYHSEADLESRRRPAYTFKNVAGKDDSAGGTEEVYFDALKAIGAANLDLRVIVDVIAGASAGGINGVVLARALAHDLPLDALTDMWLAEADIAQLLAPESKARFWSKWYVRPFVRPVLGVLIRKNMINGGPDAEMRKKLSIFLRSRWFHPPLDGRKLTRLLLDALTAMGGPQAGGASLLPAGHRLDLLVTVTDFYGSERTIFIHDPPILRERDHRHVIRFTFHHLRSGELRSDFGFDDIPSLAFAARATASYPGAFQPMQVQEMDGVLAERGQSWATRERFLHSNFHRYQEFGMDPEDAVFVDGSILNNKPISEAIEAVKTHAAFREVDRRLVFVDPHAQVESLPSSGPVPGFLTTIRSALSDLPRFEPVYDDLASIGRVNEDIRQLRAAIARARPRVVALVEKALGGELDRPADAARIGRWRLRVARLLSANEGVSYDNYVRLMVGEALDYLGRLLCAACDYPENSPRARWVARVLEIWANRHGIYCDEYVFSRAREDETILPSFMKFIVNFDISYRIRQMQFVIESINDLYSRLNEPGFCSVSPSALDTLKQSIHRCLEALRAQEEAAFLGGPAVTAARDLFFGQLETSISADDLLAIESFVSRHGEAITALIAQIGQLSQITEEADAVLGSAVVQAMDDACRRELLISYVGFPGWDVITLPMTSMHEFRAARSIGELKEIKVDRISPVDATTITPGGAAVLKGGGFGGFAGFFSRAARENDYLWGRLHAVERLLDIVASAADRDPSAGLDMRPFKKRAFDIVLREESRRLTLVNDLLRKIEATVERL